MGIAERKAELTKNIERSKRKLAQLEDLPDFGELNDGTVLAMAVTISRSRAYTYIGFKTDGRWYVTGATGPNGVTSEGLADWLTTGARRLDSAEVLAEVATVQVATIDLGAALDGLLSSIPAAMGRKRGSEWRNQMDGHLAETTARYDAYDREMAARSDGYEG